MPVYQYTVKGNPYQKSDLSAQLHPLFQSLSLSAQIRTIKNSVILEVEGEEQAFQKLEPELLKTLTRLINIQSYSKREYNRRQKRFSPKNFIDTENEHDHIKKAARYLNRGQIIALETPRGFHILCNATKSNAVKSLRDIIKEPTKPFPVIFKNLLNIEKQILLSSKERDLLKSEEHPFVLVKKRDLHRLEKERYKANLLSRHINMHNHRIAVALPLSSCYQKLYEEISFPLVSLVAQNKEGESIRSEQSLLETYGEVFQYVLRLHADGPQHLSPRKIYQIIYGSPKSVTPYEAPLTPDGSIEIRLEKEEASFADCTLAPLKILLDEDGREQPMLSAISLLFTHLPFEDILTLDLPIDVSTRKALHDKWRKNSGTVNSRSLLTLFDAIASLSGTFHEKSFETESLLLAEEYFEVCEEDLFDYTIENDTVAIDIVSEYCNNPNPKHLASTLINTISTIITEIARQKGQSITLKGELFTLRDLTELTIEKLEEADISYAY